MSGRVPAEPRRVLIIKPSALGDVVTALPVLRALRRAFPDTRIDWIVRDIYAPLLSAEEDLGELLTYDRDLLGRFWKPGEGMRHVRALKKCLRAAGYDWAIDLQGLLRSGMFAKWTGAPVRAGFADAREGAPLLYTHRFHIPVGEHHTVERNILLARELGVDARPEDLRLTVPTAARRSVDDLFAENNLPSRGFVALVPPTTWSTKLYPLRRWRAVAGQLAEDRPTVVLGGPNDTALCAAIAKDIPGVVDLSGRTDLPRLTAVLAAAEVVVCCDSASKFIAQAVGTPPVVLIGPTIARRTGPYADADPPGEAVIADVPCQGCLKKQCSHVTCMDLIPLGRVVQAVQSVLQSAGRE
ncbi:MAG: glycosyltransferase family 9 protein [Phycisphaerae bacterium]